MIYQRIKHILISFIIISSSYFLAINQSFGEEYLESKIIKISQLEDDYDDDFDEDFSDFNFQVSPKKDPYDPFEKVNRKIFIFNDFVDRYAFEHIAKTYRDSFPGRVRKSIRNFFQNLEAPFSVINSILQGNVENSMASFSSFLINSTLGIGGLFNVAQAKNVRYYQEDLGQTFAKYGIGSGPYLMLPFMGPSNVRDSSGMLVKNVSSPLSINIFKVGDDQLMNDKILLGLTTVSLIDKRESLLKIISDLRNNSFDPYAIARSAYTQNRQSKINNENKL